MKLHRGKKEDATDGGRGELLHDNKTDTRTRSVPITDLLCRELLIKCKGRNPDDPVCDMRYTTLDHQWHETRKAAELKELRFKDLRAQPAIYGERAGVPLTTLQRTLGHADISMTRRYQRHEAAMSREDAAAIERAMGLEGGDGPI